MAMTRNRLARQGQHPREARILETTSPGADIRGSPLNQGVDDDAKCDSAAAAAKAKAAPSAAASSSQDDFDFDPDGDNQQQQTPTDATPPNAELPAESSQPRQQQPKILDEAVGDDYKD